MQRRLTLFALVFVSALAFVGGASACGDGDGRLTLEEYFERVKATREIDEGRFAPLQEDFATAFDPEAAEQDRIEALRIALGGAVDANRAAAEDYDDLEPPIEAAEVHNELVDAISDAADILDGLSDRAEDVDSQAELEELLAEFEEPELVEADERPKRACAALQTIADENNVKLDLAC